MVAAVTLLVRAPLMPNTPAVTNDQVLKCVQAVLPDWPVKDSAVEFVLERDEAVFHVVASRVEVASEAPVVPGSAVFSCVKARTFVVPPDNASRAWFAAVTE